MAIPLSGVSPIPSSCEYVGASSASIKGGGFVEPTNAADLTIYGLPTLTSLSYAGGASVAGTICAPEASFSGAGGSTFIGSLVANTFVIKRNPELTRARYLLYAEFAVLRENRCAECVLVPWAFLI